MDLRGEGSRRKRKDAPAASTQTTAATPVANPKDVLGLDAMVAAIYDVISGPPGGAGLETGLIHCFSKDARLVAVRGAQARRKNRIWR